MTVRVPIDFTWSSLTLKRRKTAHVLPFVFIAATVMNYRHRVAATFVKNVIIYRPKPRYHTEENFFCSQNHRGAIRILAIPKTKVAIEGILAADPSNYQGMMFAWRRGYQSMVSSSRLRQIRSKAPSSSTGCIGTSQEFSTREGSSRPAQACLRGP